LEIDEEIPDSAKGVDLPSLETHLRSRLNQNLTCIRTIYRRDHSTCAMVVGFPRGVADSPFYDLQIEFSSPLEEGRPVWPFTVEEEMGLLGPEESWEVSRVMVNPPKGESRTCTVTLRRTPFRQRTE
jgi:hypothetical protein